MSTLGALHVGLKDEFLKAYMARRNPDGTFKTLPGRRFIYRDRCKDCLHTPSGRCLLHPPGVQVCDLHEYTFWFGDIHVAKTSRLVDLAVVPAPGVVHPGQAQGAGIPGQQPDLERRSVDGLDS